MQIKRIFLGLVIAFALNSCINTIDGNGEVTKEQRTVSSFNKIDISGGYEVLINQGSEERLELEVDENLLELIETETKNNTLYISSKKSIGNATSLKLYITVVDVNDIDVSGAIELKNKGTYQTENLEIEVSGAGDIDLDVDVENLTMDMSGASETTLSGTANNFEIEISGAGELQAKKLKTRNTTIAISGAGSAVVFAKKTLKVEVSGAGSVKYKGSPKVEKDISGAGSVEEL
jgi:Putative auto-transporter adhesin, head GIN domain